MTYQTCGTVSATLSAEERVHLLRLARAYDRSVSGEVRRAVRFYLAHFELVDKTLRNRPDDVHETQ